MKATQKSIVISTFVLEAIIFNSFFCNWKGGLTHRIIVDHWSGRSPDLSGMIMSFHLFGIYKPSQVTFPSAIILGIAVPLMFLGAALFIYTLDSNASKIPTKDRTANN